MAGSKQAGLVAVLAVVLGVGSFYALRPREPSYQGKSLTTWLKTINEDREGLPGDFFHAIQHMGTNAVPHLLKLLQRRPSRVKQTLYYAVNRVFGTELSYDKNVALAHLRSLAGFQALGPRANSVIPQLVALLDDPDLGVSASVVLGYMGPEATPVLMRRMVSTNPVIRWLAASALSDLGTNAEPAITLLVERLNDSSESADVQRSCARALGKIGKEPERVVPALAASLSNTEVRVPAMKALYLFGTNATGAIPALLPLLQDPNTNLAGATRRVLGIIDPEKWKPSSEKGGTP
jgi:hypothetical protein